MSDREGYTPDHAGIQKLLASSMAQRASVGAGRAIEATARSLTPTTEPAFAKGLRTRPLQVATLTGRGGRELRAGAAVETTATAGAPTEARHHVLTRSIRATRT